MVSPDQQPDPKTVAASNGPPYLAEQVQMARSHGLCGFPNSDGSELCALPPNHESAHGWETDAPSNDPRPPSVPEPEGRHVVLVRPGDVLVLGNLGEVFLAQTDLLQEATLKMKAATGISILACYQPVTISTTSAGLADLLEYARAGEADASSALSESAWRDMRLRIEETITGATS